MHVLHEDDQYNTLGDMPKVAPTPSYSLLQVYRTIPRYFSVADDFKDKPIPFPVPIVAAKPCHCTTNFKNISVHSCSAF